MVGAVVEYADSFGAWLELFTVGGDISQSLTIRSISIEVDCDGDAEGVGEGENFGLAGEEGLVSHGVGVLFEVSLDDVLAHVLLGSISHRHVLVREVAQRVGVLGL